MASDLKRLKTRIVEAVEAHRDELIELSRRIHANPELGLQEEQASRWLCELLEAREFRVERGICELPTAFRAVAGDDRPRVAFLAEYDALPGLGHGCGHNLIATSAVGAAIAVRAVLERTGGSVAVLGTPAEENAGGKIIMASRGAFQGLDAAMLAHPGSRDAVHARALACETVLVEYFGREAHAAARPEAGVNALDALVTAYNAISVLRQQVRQSARIHGIITEGGKAANIIPDHTAAVFTVRAEDDEYLDELRARVMACFEAGALATGARLEYRWTEMRYAAMQTNSPLADAYQANLAVVGREATLRPSRSMGSTDMGNVSALLPAIHPTIAVAPPSVSIHSREFAEYAGGPAGDRALIDAAKAMAMTAVDVLTDPDLRRRMEEEFRASTAERRETPG